MYKRKICIVTGSRAEYSLLYWLLKAICLDSMLELQLVVTGMHLSYAHGYTINEIEKDGFLIAESIETLLSSNSHAGMSKSTGLAMISFSDCFKRLSPDILVLLGDRFETFAAAVSGNMLNIPIAHLHGGELSYGSVDDSLRHAITKLSQLHFPVAEQYKNRIIQMGEAEDRVYNMGAPGLDWLDTYTFLSQNDLMVSLNIEFAKENNFLITYHSVTRDDECELTDLSELITALESFPNAVLIFTEANCDPGGQLINEYLNNYCGKKENAYLFKSLGVKYYLNLAKYIDVIIGNSSSGVIEVPCIGKPSVNIGSRQDGRIKPCSVIDVCMDSMEIIKAIKCTKSAQFKQGMLNMNIPFKTNNTSNNIKNVLKEVELDNICRKEFIDIDICDVTV